MLEAIRIRKAGYAIRVTMEDFAKRYRAILGPKKKTDTNYKAICENIFKEVL
jgi:myosin heavy subunit